jgi:hypothetical protein
MSRLRKPTTQGTASPLVAVEHVRVAAWAPPAAAGRVCPGPDEAPAAVSTSR